MIRQHGRLIRWGAVAAMLVSVLLWLWVVPWRDGFRALSEWIEGLGVWGPVMFVVVFAISTLLLLPAWWLSLLAGTMFGLVWGTALASLASTLVAALAFGVSRHLGRNRVEHAERHHPTFKALDSAVREGGWRIVALTRLSPFIPFGMQNYLYGLTPIGFWTCIATSSVFMLPGVFVYVYLGSLTRTGLEAADASTSPNVNMWILRAVGLLATAAVVIYVTRLARRKLHEQTSLTKQADASEEEAMPMSDSNVKTVLLVVVAVVMLSSAVYAQARPQMVHGWFAAAISSAGVAATGTGTDETDIAQPTKPTVDHRQFNELLGDIVTPDGLVDYGQLRRDPSRLTGYLEMLAGVELDALAHDDALALLINAYNAFTLQLIVDHWPVDSIMDIPDGERWDARRWRIGDRTFSLTEIEHKWLRQKFVEPRIHFAINCASVGCPPLLDEAYVGERLEAQLDRVTRVVHRDGSRWFAYDKQAEVVRLTKLYDWYAEDFEQVAPTVLDFVARYSPPLREAIEGGRRPRIEWLEYDWSLNAGDMPPTTMQEAG